MKFGTGLNTERTQKYARVRVQNDIRTSKQTSLIFNCVTLVSVSLAPLARQLSQMSMIFLIETRHNRRKTRLKKQGTILSSVRITNNTLNS